MLMGLAAINPTATFVKLDPFAPKIVPKIAVVPPTPDQTSVTNSFVGKLNCNDITNSPLKRNLVSISTKKILYIIINLHSQITDYEFRSYKRLRRFTR